MQPRHGSNHSRLTLKMPMRTCASNEGRSTACAPAVPSQCLRRLCGRTEPQAGIMGLLWYLAGTQGVWISRYLWLPPKAYTLLRMYLETTPQPFPGTAGVPKAEAPHPRFPETTPGP
eukprot:436978-Rhodomonas_salina.1